MLIKTGSVARALFSNRPKTGKYWHCCWQVLALLLASTGNVAGKYWHCCWKDWQILAMLLASIGTVAGKTGKYWHVADLVCCWVSARLKNRQEYHIGNILSVYTKTVIVFLSSWELYLDKLLLKNSYLCYSKQCVIACRLECSFRLH